MGTGGAREKWKNQQKQQEAVWNGTFFCLVRAAQIQAWVIHIIYTGYQAHSSPRIKCESGKNSSFPFYSPRDREPTLPTLDTHVTYYFSF